LGSQPHPKFRSLEGCELVAVADASPERLKGIGKAYPQVRLESSLHDLLEDSRIDAIALATPADTHYELGKRIIESGRSVFIEKPLARTVSECEKLIELAQAGGIVLMVGHTFEYNAAVECVGDYIEKQKLGELYYIYSQRLNLGIVRQDVNAMWNLAPHDISIALKWLNDMPVAVNARGYTYLQTGVEDVVYLNLEFASGVAAHIHVSWLDPGKVRRTTVVGSEKMVVYDDASADAKIQLFDKGIDRQHIGGSMGEFDTFGKFQLIQRAGDVLIPRIDFVEPLRVECAEFLMCVRDNREPRTSGESGLRVVRILEAASKSLQNGGALIELNYRG
jgi:predicted dehydrogenase